MKKLFFLCFYNTNFVLNFSIIIHIFLPFLFVNTFYWNEKIFFISIFIIIFSTFVYNITYIVNDFFDNKKDKEQKVYKMSLVSNYEINIVKYFFIFLWLLICFFVLSWYFLRLNNSVFIFFFASIFYIFLISIVHSRYKKLKIITLFLERNFKIIFPLTLLYVIFDDIAFIRDFLICILVFYPIFSDALYKDYIQKKLKIDIKNRFYIYGIYYFFLWILYFYNQEISINYYNILVFIMIFFLIWIVYQFRFLKFQFLEKIYKNDINEKKQLLFELFINIFCLVIIFLYEIIFRFWLNLDLWKFF